MTNETTVYPNDIDSRRYFSDLALKNYGFMEKYQSLLAERNYKDIQILINSGTYENESYTVGDTFNAETMNMFENRVAAIETYLKSDDNQVQKPDLLSYGSTEPDKNTIGYSWIC